MKIIVGLLFAIFPWLGRVGDFLLGWTEGNRKVQIAFVMFIFPLIMNAIQYYIIDIFIKKQEPRSPHLPADDEDGDDEDGVVGGRGTTVGDNYGNVEGDANIPEIQPSSAIAGALNGHTNSNFTHPKTQKKSNLTTRTRSFDDSSFVYSEDDDRSEGEEAGKASSSRGFLTSKDGGHKNKKRPIRKGSGVVLEEYDPEVDGETSPSPSMR